jgi:hypothetical protein
LDPINIVRKCEASVRIEVSAHAIDWRKIAALSRSVHLAGEFIEPDIECGALLGRQYSKHYAHSEAGMGIDDCSGKLAGAAAVADTDADRRVLREGD